MYNKERVIFEKMLAPGRLVLWKKKTVQSLCATRMIHKKLQCGSRWPCVDIQALIVGKEINVENCNHKNMYLPELGESQRYPGYSGS
uniref:FLYWCH-type domain-containing protein n=1 Tax=Heterorhabditis bacteriophora TaxID=37862 RepID=A0A1I7WEM1_HETBA